MAEVEILASLINITIYIANLKCLLVLHKTLHLLCEHVALASHVVRSILINADGIKLCERSIAVCLIESVVMAWINHIVLRHVYEETNFVSVCSLLIWIEFAYLCNDVNDRARTCSTGKTGTNVECHIIVARCLCKIVDG